MNKFIFIFIFIGIFWVSLFFSFLYLKKHKKENYDSTNSTNNKLKIAIVTCENRKDNYIKIHDENLTKYCNKHGYTYIRCHNEPLDIKLPIYWYKIAYVNKILKEQNFDYVLWVDSDTLVTNMNIKIEYIVKSNKDIYMAREIDGGILTNVLNAGIFMIKNSEIGHKFLEECLEKLKDKSCFNDDYTKILGKWAGECYEQGHMNKLIYTKYMDYTDIVSNDIFHSSAFIPFTIPFITHIFGHLSDKLIPIANNMYSDNICRFLHR